MINFPSIQSDFKTEPNDVTRCPLEYPAKKLEHGFTYFGNVFSIYLATKNMVLHMHFNAMPSGGVAERVLGGERGRRDPLPGRAAPPQGRQAQGQLGPAARGRQGGIRHERR